MRYFNSFILCLFLLLMSGVAYSVKAEQFFETLYDIPVMPGLIEVPELALSFDKADGRISEAAALADEDLNDLKIIDFYSLSLMQMGWHSSGQATYIREGEKLSIQLERSEQGDNAQKLVKFTLSPL